MQPGGVLFHCFKDPNVVYSMSFEMNQQQLIGRFYVGWMRDILVYDNYPSLHAIVGEQSWQHAPTLLVNWTHKGRDKKILPQANTIALSIQVYTFIL